MNGKKSDRHLFIVWLIVGLFSIVLLWKIVVTPFEVDLSVFIAFILALFSIALSIFYYVKIHALVDEVKNFYSGQAYHADDPNLPSEAPVHDTHEKEEKAELDPTLQLEFEERTLKLKEEERKELLERLISRAGLNEEEKKVYISQFEKVDDDLFNIRSNLNQLRKKINQSFSEMFVLEKTKLIREMIEKIGVDLVVQGSFLEINERFKSLKSALPQASVKFLEENAIMDSDGNLTRKGYREFMKVVKKM